MPIETWISFLKYEELLPTTGQLYVISQKQKQNKNKNIDGCKHIFLVDGHFFLLYFYLQLNYTSGVVHVWVRAVLRMVISNGLTCCIYCNAYMLIRFIYDNLDNIYLSYNELFVLPYLNRLVRLLWQFKERWQILSVRRAKVGRLLGLFMDNDLFSIKPRTFPQILCMHLTWLLVW